MSGAERGPRSTGRRSPRRLAVARRPEPGTGSSSGRSPRPASASAPPASRGSSPRRCPARRTTSRRSADPAAAAPAPPATPPLPPPPPASRARTGLPRRAALPREGLQVQHQLARPCWPAPCPREPGTYWRQAPAGDRLPKRARVTASDRPQKHARVRPAPQWAPLGCTYPSAVARSLPHHQVQLQLRPSIRPVPEARPQAACRPQAKLPSLPLSLPRSLPQLGWWPRPRLWTLGPASSGPPAPRMAGRHRRRAPPWRCTPRPPRP
mmetsp:Transcript_101682/g.327994  ORF Transcript_101682/g.327994 Transcript_101682/m.327994 type:complete len:266 (-) Transcript_101682:117-914(-)